MLSEWLYSLLSGAILVVFKTVQMTLAAAVFISSTFSVQPNTVTLLAVGDIMFARDVNRRIELAGNVHYPFEQIAPVLQEGDIVFGNLETAITPGERVGADIKLFSSDPGTEHALKAAGFTILSLANNHVPDFKQAGIENTIKALDDAGIAYVGAGMNDTEARAPVILQKNGLRIAFLAYMDPRIAPSSYEAGTDHAGVAYMSSKTVGDDIAKAKEQADLVIVSIHAGNEYVHEPIKTQRNFAHTAIDAGAALVIGHHPHVLQPVEDYNGGLILYSLGNFVFDQTFSKAVQESVIAKIALTKDGVVSKEFLPIRIQHAQPFLVEGPDGEKSLWPLKLDQ